MSIAQQFRKTAPAPQRASVSPTPETRIPVSDKPSRKGVGGRPRKADALEPITLRLPRSEIARWKAMGTDWRARMAKALAEA